MDLTINNYAKKSPESDTDAEAPLQISRLTKALSLSSGLKRGSSSQHQQKIVEVAYKECLKNHAANLGGLALDGCGEFMPSPTASPLDPNSFKCVACGCHRNFHRRDPPGASGHKITTTTTTHFPPPALHWTSSPSPGPVSSSGPSSDPSSSPASPTPQNSLHPSAPHLLWALSTSHSGALDESHPHPQNHHPSFYPTVMNPNGRKRARTKFTQEQKEKMYAFAEKLGWKMQRGIDETSVEDFCTEVGVKRNVFKVWMHNNKHRRENSYKVGVSGNGDRVGFDNNAGNRTNNNNGNNGNNVSSNNNFDDFDNDHQISIQVSPSSS